ncbi:MAG: RidA family protein [Candidatus Bipolaricaulota bacterium]
MSTIESRLKEKGIEIPTPPEPEGAYIPARQSGNMVFCSGQGPLKDGEFQYIGRVGDDLSVEEGYQAARICAINCLAEIKYLIGSLEKIEKVIKVRGFVRSAEDFGNQPEVVNGASELLQEVFGERGRHARAALGTSELPRNIPVEVEMVVSLKS